MRQELIDWIKTCDNLQMGELYSKMKRIKTDSSLEDKNAL